MNTVKEWQGRETRYSRRPVIGARYIDRVSYDPTEAIRPVEAIRPREAVHMALSQDGAQAFGRRVKRLREERQWTQDRLAIEAGRAVGHAGGFNRSTIKHYEAGERREMDADIVLGVARALGTNVEYLLTGAEPRAQLAPEVRAEPAVEARLSALEQLAVRAALAPPTLGPIDGQRERATSPPTEQPAPLDKPTRSPRAKVRRGGRSSTP